MVEVLIKWDVQETYILRYLLHCHEESESYTTSESRCLDSGLEKLIREPQSAQNTIPAKRCEYVPLGSFFGFLLRRRCALSHVSWSMIASWVFLNTILSSGVAARRFFSLKFSRMLLHSTVSPTYFIARQQACIQIAVTIYTQACLRTSLFCFLLYQLSLWWVKYRAQPEAIST